jgi:hypothetical protein
MVPEGGTTAGHERPTEVRTMVARSSFADRPEEAEGEMGPSFLHKFTVRSRFVRPSVVDFKRA